MAFIDNSKDIIIDAVLTDLGRQRLSQGRFNIARFGLGDDEINYALYNNKDTRGSAYFDLDLLKTPVFEAFTNNISSMNSRLVSYSDNTLSYLPVIALNTLGASQTALIENNPLPIQGGFEQYSDNNIGYTFLVAVNTDTKNQLGINLKVLDGSSETGINYIRLDQGIDNSTDTAVSNDKILDQQLLEEQYTLEIDNRFGFVSFDAKKLEPTFIDDDQVALYSFNIFDDMAYISKLLRYNEPNNRDSKVSIAGARGTALRFAIYASSDLQSDNSSLFDLYGVSATINGDNYMVIHTTATVTGLKTGYSIDIPVSFIKKV